MVSAFLVAVTSVVAYVLYRRMVEYPMPAGTVSRTAMRAGGVTETAFPPALYWEQSSLSYSGAVRVLRLSGGVHALGAAHGRFLAELAPAPVAALGAAIEAAVASRGALAGMIHQPRLRWQFRLLGDAIGGHQLAEMANLLRGVHHTHPETLDYAELVRQHAALDVGRAAPWSGEVLHEQVARSLTVVTRASDPGGNRLLVGRSFALPGTGDGGAAAAASPVVFHMRPAGVIPFTSVAWPGFVGVVSGVNAERIAVMVHPLRTADVRVTRSAQPVALLCRDVLENARSLADAVAILEHASPLGAAAFVIVDGNTQRWAVVERSPERFAVRTEPSPVVVDLLEAEPFRDDADNDRSRRTTGMVARRKRVEELLRGQPVQSPAALAAVLRDRHAAGGALLPPGHRAAVADAAAVHTVIFDVAGLVAWVSEGPSAHGRLRAIDLRHALGDDRVAAAPPPDIPADPAVEASAITAVQLARADLMAARRAAQRGALARARELAQRALVRSPQLVDALLLAGNLAQRGGDGAGAQRLLRRLLELGPDDSRAEQEARAYLQER